MVSKTLIPMVSVAALVAGKTPSGFTPASNTDLIVVYDQTAAMNGVVVAKAATANQPTLATQTQLTGTSYAVIMVDLDIPSNSTPHTFLHWMQTDLTPATAASAITSSNGTVQAFTLTNSKNTAAIVNYTQPSPPAQNPLSHRYTEVLIDTSAMSASALNTLMTAAQSRVGFDVATVLQTAGLTSNVVAGNSFNVTNTDSTNSNAATGGNVAASNSTTDTGNGGKKGANGNATKGSKKTRTGAAAAQATGADGNGNGKGKGKGNGKNNGTAATTTQSSTSGAQAAAGAGLPAATGASVSNNLTNSGATGKNGTGTVTTSGAMGGYGLTFVPMSVLAGLLGAFVYAL